AILLDRRAIRPKTVCVARIHMKDVGALTGHLHVAVVAESVVGVNPAVDPTSKCVLVTVCIDNSKRTEFDGLLISDPVTIRVHQPPDVWDRPCDGFFVAQWKHADGN